MGPVRVTDSHGGPRDGTRGHARLARKLVAAGAAVGLAAGLAVPALSARSAAPRLMGLYTVTIGVKGGGSASDQHAGTANGDMVTVTTGHSYSIDAKVVNATLVGGPRRPGIPTDGAGYARTTLNGTWTARGTKWIDVVNKVTGPFSCGGTIRPHVSPQTSLSWKRSGATIVFTLAAVQQELYDNGLDSCPSGVSGEPVSGTSPNVYEGTFKLPLSAVGQKTITAQVSGPLPKARAMMVHNCLSVGVKNCSLAWHGVVRFKLTRLMKLP